MRESRGGKPIDSSRQEGAVSFRVAVSLAVGAVVALGVGWLVYDKITDLEQHLAGLTDQVNETEEKLAEAEARADEAARVAAAAGVRAQNAEQRAGKAEQRAETAEQLVGEVEQSAREATQRRAVAEEARQVAEAETEEARAVAEMAREAERAAIEEARRARAEAESIQRQREAELDRLHEALSKIVETRRTAIGVVLNLGSDRIEFKFDMSELGSKERELLARIAGVLIGSADESYAIQVFGHTDDVGTVEYNQGLSERRAKAVRDYLVVAGVDPEIISMKGLGKSMPLVEGADEESRARNRRVEIGIIDTMISFGPERSNR